VPLKGLRSKTKWFHGLLQATCREVNFILTSHNSNNNSSNKGSLFCQCHMLLLFQKYLRRAAFQLLAPATLQATSLFLLFLSELEFTETL